MATSAMKTPLTPFVRAASRGFAAQAAAKPKAATAELETKVTVKPLENKVTLAAVEKCGAISRVSIVFKTGSRNETEDNRGAAAAIRSYAGLATSKYTNFWIVRNLQQEGGYLSATGDRETTAFTLVATRNQIEKLLPLLAEVACRPAFKPWELSDNLPLLKYQMSLLTSQQRALDILHKAAYRTGLGNSIFIKKDYLGKHDSETLKHFYEKGFTANRATVAAVNVDGDVLETFGCGLPLATGDAPAGNGAYFGGEIRKDKYGKTAHVAIATEGASLKDGAQAVTFAILQNALGVSPTIKRGIGASPITKSVNAAAPTSAVTSLNVNYSDSGLFGLFVSASAAEAGKAVEAAVRVLKQGRVSDEDVARGKALLRAKVLDAYDNGADLLEEVSGQAALIGRVASESAILEAINKVSAAEVNAAAKKVAGGKLSLAGFGNLTSVPYLDQLK